MTNQEALAYIDRLWNKYGALYSDEKNAEHEEEAELMQKYFMSLGAAKEALEKIDKLDKAMEQIAQERDKSYEGEALGHGWGAAISFGDIGEGDGMTREQAISYLRNSGFSDEQINEIVKALEPTTKNDLGVDREDAVERLNALKQFIGYDEDSEIVKATQKSIDMAISALEHPERNVVAVVPCGDTISRQAVIDLMMQKWGENFSGDDAMQESIDAIRVLPSVTPQEPFKPMVEIDLYSVIKQKYIERKVLDKLDETITDALDKSTDQKESQTLRWVLDKISEVVKE